MCVIAIAIDYVANQFIWRGKYWVNMHGVATYAALLLASQFSQHLYACIGGS